MEHFNNLIELILVENNKLQAEYISSIFDSKYYRIKQFFDGEEAYKFLLQNTSLDVVVLLSYHLKSMNGIEMMQNLRNMGKEFAFIFFTADKTVETAIEAMKSGALDFLPKTAKLPELLPSVVNKVYRLQQDRLARERMKRELERSEAHLKIILKSLQDSIKYAQRIQDAIFTPKEFIKYLFPEHFILYKPKNVVGGDFYWATQRKDKIFFAAADCTGHGVPGGFMTMLGITLLNEIVLYNENDSAASILKKLSEAVIKSLRQTGKIGEAKDGMDISFCILDTKSHKLSFAGAHNSLYVFRNQQLTILKADKIPIGYYRIIDAEFTNHTIFLENNDVLYLFSDGYADQFGGLENRKFLTTRFQELLREIHLLPFEEQEKILLNHFLQWKRNYEQLDDILVWGIKILFSEHSHSQNVSNLENKIILIAEDEEENFILFQEILSFYNVEVLHAKNGKEAVEYCRKNSRIDLILTDIRMPIMNGYEATQEIKQLRPEIPIIIQTAYTMAGEKEKCFKAGCNDYITKPINAEELINLISKYLQ